MLSTELNHDVVEGNLDASSITYRREFNENVPADVMISMELWDNYYFHLDKLKDHIDLQVDGKTFSIPLVENKEFELVHASGDPATGGVAFGGSVIVEGRYLFVKARLTKEQEQLISRCHDYRLIVYVGKKHTVFKATEKQLTTLKTFLTAKS